MANLSFHLLGSPWISLGEEDLEIKPRKALALLVYLAVTGEHHTRDFLATLLWPHSDQRCARHSLRSRLSELKQILGNSWIDAGRENVGLRAGYWLDVTEFQNYLSINGNDPQRLIAAADLYRDDFLTASAGLDRVFSEEAPRPPQILCHMEVGGKA